MSKYKIMFGPSNKVTISIRLSTLKYKNYNSMSIGLWSMTLNHRRTKIITWRDKANISTKLRNSTKMITCRDPINQFKSKVKELNGNDMNESIIWTPNIKKNNHICTLALKVIEISKLDNFRMIQNHE